MSFGFANHDDEVAYVSATMDYKNTKQEEKIDWAIQELNKVISSLKKLRDSFHKDPSLPIMIDQSEMMRAELEKVRNLKAYPDPNHKDAIMMGQMVEGRLEVDAQPVDRKETLDRAVDLITTAAFQTILQENGE